jgi:hypothetical protein
MQWGATREYIIMQIRPYAQAMRAILSRRRFGLRLQMGAMLSLLLALVSSHADGSDRHLVVAVSLGASRVPLSEVKCLLLNDNSINILGANYSDDSHVASLIKKHIGVTDIFRASAGVAEGGGKCEFFIVAIVLDTTMHSVRYMGDPAIAFASVQICKNGSAEYCTYRNIYFFQRLRDKYLAFSLAMMAFAQPYATKWNIFTIIESDLER